jgi:hypothetical protein
MAVHRLSLDTFQKVRQHIQNTLVLPQLENSPQLGFQEKLDQMPEPTTLDELGDMFRAATLVRDGINVPNADGRWFLSSVNPGAALLRLPGLRLRPDLRLVTYLLRVKDGGIGYTCAIAEDRCVTSILQTALPEGTEWHYPPIPEGSLTNVMEAIVGDRTAASFVIASLLRRELSELGAVGKDGQWVHHHLVDRVPDKVKWVWKDGVSRDLAPKVKVLADGRAAVEFFSCRIKRPLCLFRHYDTYGDFNYIPTLKDQIIATADRPAAAPEGNRPAAAPANNRPTP